MTISLEERVARAREVADELSDLHWPLSGPYNAATAIIASFAASIRESERAACEAIADEEVDRCTREGRSELAAFRIREAIAARKGKGEA